jgi:ABC-2 type transport system permease protein
MSKGKMKKYLQLAKITFEEYFVYRLNFLLWRFRSFVFFLTLVFFWLAIYGTREEFLGYQKDQMLTYVVGIAFLRSIVLGSRSADLAGQVRSGELTKFLLQPIKTIGFWFTRDIVDKLLNFFFTIAEIVAVLMILKFWLYFPQNLTNLIYFGILSLLALFLYFFLSFALSVVAFWTEEIWATRWLFGVIFLEFLAGAFFPLDVLPSWLTKIIYFTPFPYLVFFPLKIWLEQLSTGMIVQAILICSGWLLFFWWLSTFLWKKGAKNYGAYGG